MSCLRLSFVRSAFSFNSRSFSSSSFVANDSNSVWYACFLSLDLAADSLFLIILRCLCWAVLSDGSSGGGPLFPLSPPPPAPITSTPFPKPTTEGSTFGSNENMPPLSWREGGDGWTSLTSFTSTSSSSSSTDEPTLNKKSSSVIISSSRTSSLHTPFLPPETISRHTSLTVPAGACGASARAICMRRRVDSDGEVEVPTVRRRPSKDIWERPPLLGKSEAVRTFPKEKEAAEAEDWRAGSVFLGSGVAIKVQDDSTFAETRTRARSLYISVTVERIVLSEIGFGHCWDQRTGCGGRVAGWRGKGLAGWRSRVTLWSKWTAPTGSPLPADEAVRTVSFSGMGSNGIDHSYGELCGESIPIRKEVGASCDESGMVQSCSPEEGSTIKSPLDWEHEEKGSDHCSSVSEISQAEEMPAGSSPQRGLNHCITSPVGYRRNVLFDDIAISRSMADRSDSPRHDLFDRLSEREKKKLIIELVKIQKDGTVEVDLTKSAPVASELLELHSVEGSFKNLEDTSTVSDKSIPRLNIAVLVVGTRGDVQPFLAMAKRLQEFGHHVRLATHANFKNFVRSAGVDFYPLGGDPRVLAGYMVRNKGFIPSGPGEISIQRKQLKSIIESLLPACTEPDIETGVPFRAQAIIANPPAYGHAHVAEALGVPLHIFFTMPWTPTYEFPHPLARVPQAGNWVSYVVVDLLIWWSIRGYINDFRKRKLKLSPIAYFSTYHGSISHLPTGYMWSPHLVPKPSDWGPLVDVVGYCFLNLGSKYQPQEEFVQWLRKGSKPIYIGFGSMPLEDPKKITNIIFEALKDTGTRGIIGRGWGDLGIFREVPDNVFLLEDCPHDWLFPQCSAVVHHGGAGTTATGLKAGCPTTIVPFFGDQFFWGDRIYQRGLGPAPIPISQLSVDSLSNAVRFMLQPEVKARAMEVKISIEKEDGVKAAVDAFHRHLPPELPLPGASSDDEGIPIPNPLQWLFVQIEKWCCLPCNNK